MRHGDLLGDLHDLGAAGIALINSLGNLGGFVAPYAVGALVDSTGDARAGLYLLSAVLLITALATYLYGRRTGAGKVHATRDEALVADADGRSRS